MKLFTVGPVQMYESTLNIRNKQVPYFRTEEFSEMMLTADKKLKELLNVGKNSETIYLTASGTGAMEAAVMNCFDDKDKLLVINGGSFGQRFAEICSIHNIDFTEIKVPFNVDLNYSMLQQYENKGYTGLLVNLDETSIGKLYNIELLSDFCKKNNLYFVVDAIGAVFADKILFDENNIDVLIFSSQKALSLAPGMAVVMLSERIVQNKVNNSNVKSLYFDFKSYISNFKRGQTPFTPAVGIFIEFAQRIDDIYNKGIQNIIDETENKAKYFRNKAREKGFKLPEYSLSNAVTPILIDGYAYDMYLKLKNEYDLTVTPNGGEYRDKIIRVGHMGNLTCADFDELIENMCIVSKILKGRA